MRKAPVNYMDRYFLIVSLAVVAIVSWSMNNIYNDNKLEIAEKNILGLFKEFKIHKENVYLPSIKVAGPDGSIVDLRDSGGKFTVLNVWATWCMPCVKELPSLRKLDNIIRRGGKWRVVAVSIDKPEDMLKVAKFTKRYKVENIANYNDYNMANCFNYF